MASSSGEKLPHHQVFINFRGPDMRHGFVSHLISAFKSSNINVFIDDYKDRGQNLDLLLNRIEESKIALAIFSAKYTESIWCLTELVKINKCKDEGRLVVIPIFYKVEPDTVRDLRGKFGDVFRDLTRGDERRKEWKKALKATSEIMGITVCENSEESEIVNTIVKMVKGLLIKIPSEGIQNACVDLSKSSSDTTYGASSGNENDMTFGNRQRLMELEKKLDFRDKRTRIIGVVGMAGIGKTTLIKELFNKWKFKFARHALVDKIRLQSRELGCDYLPKLLLEKLLGLEDSHTENVEDPYRMYKGELLKCKVLVILDDVSQREQIDALLGKRDWIREGSRIVIATSDTSLTNGRVHDAYWVQNLDHRNSLQLFYYHAFSGDHANPPKEGFKKLSEEFVRYSRGHPLVLEILGKELNKQSVDHWNSKLKILAQGLSPSIQSVFQVSYDELTPELKDAFLDIACFRSQDKDYVESLLASSDSGSTEAISSLKALTDKFMINTYDNRVEMHDLLYAFSRELDPKASTKIGSGNRRLWLHQDIIKGGVINVLQKKIVPANVRGIFLDLSEVKDETSLDSDYFIHMGNLRYLKFYNSHCLHGCKTDNKINIPDGLKLPLKEVRCLHWLKFPLTELPNDFNPINLVDLKLPYSEIEQLWEGNKETSFLKWVDLNHSTKLWNLSGLSKAENLQGLNLEGCTALETLPGGMKNMQKLTFLNLKGCTSLDSLPEINLGSLETLTLSGCSNLKEFPLISENIESLYLDGTAISQFPSSMEKLQRLVVLNMKNCKMLEKIPDRVGELKALQELILSDCSNLKDFPEINISSLNILLLDGTDIEVMPQIPSLQYLCLSRNDKILCLPAGISQLFQLKWLDLKYCTSLTYVPEFPPNLLRLDAHGCSSLKTVSEPLARITRTGWNHSTFIFTNCVNLEQAAKEEITLYAQRKSQMLSYARKSYNGGLVSEAFFSACFPGCEVPSWFCHETVGSVINLKLLPHWYDKRHAAIALCAVVSFLDCEDQFSRLSVTCTFKVKVEEKSWVRFTCPVGNWIREGTRKEKIESDHVFIGYTSCPYTIECLEDENCNNCTSTEASLEFTVAGGTSNKAKFEVLKCGLGLVYTNDRINSSGEAKYDMPVQMNFQEISKRVGGGKTERKKTRGDDKQPKKKQKSGRDDNSPCQSNYDASVTPRSKDDYRSIKSIICENRKKIVSTHKRQK